MKIRDMALCGLLAAVVFLCAWVSLPLGGVSFTLQTLGVFLALALLGGKRGSLTILLYLTLGAVGLPVFSGMQGGIGVLLGPTGGFLFGFLAAGLVFWLITGRFPRLQIPAAVLAMLTCYAAGSVHYACFYASGSALWPVLLQCVVPYLLPDAVKITLALYLANRLKAYALPRA